ncbi:uncharacterized protein [Watersipora subatra]|uniref:uncharacterized protein n=1 Tax=Watersipora subatra TaxID=2589382 RepID=UPI00355B1DC2
MDCFIVLVYRLVGGYTGWQDHIEKAEKVGFTAARPGIQHILAIMPPTNISISYSGSSLVSENYTAASMVTLTSFASSTATTPQIILVITTSIAIMPLLFLISVILGFYISMRRHRQQNTYGLAPIVVVTRAKKNSSYHTTSTLLSPEPEHNRYSTCDGMSTSMAPSEWSIYTADGDQPKQSGSLADC